MSELKEKTSQPSRSPLHLKGAPPAPPAAGLVSTRVRRPSGESQVSFESGNGNLPNESNSAPDSDPNSNLNPNPNPNPTPNPTLCLGDLPNEWPPPWEAGRSPGASLTRAAAAAAALAMTVAQDGDTEQVRQMRWLAKMELGDVEVDVIDGPL